jgi:hypothetical protein
MNGDDCWSKFLDGYKQASKWAKKYDAIVVGENSAVLVYPPKKLAVNVHACHLDALCQPLYEERVFANLLAIHKSNHCKGTTISKHFKTRHRNVTQEICKMFTDCCMHCIMLLHWVKPVAGIKYMDMVTDKFGVRGQVGLINFQSMPDGEFVFC